VSSKIFSFVRIFEFAVILKIIKIFSLLARNLKGVIEGQIALYRAEVIHNSEA